METYADTAFEVALTLQANQQFFPAAKVAAAFSRHDLHPAQLDTPDSRTRIYKLTLYDPPKDVTCILRDIVGNTGADVVGITAACRDLRKCGPAEDLKGRIAPETQSVCESCDWFDSEIQALAQIAGVFTSGGDRKLVVVGSESLEAAVAKYRAHILSDHSPASPSLLRRYDPVLTIRNFGAAALGQSGSKDNGQEP
jgi:hypothetical protein